MRRSRRAVLRAAGLLGGFGAAGCASVDRTTPGGGQDGGDGGSRTRTAAATASRAEATASAAPETATAVPEVRQWTTFQADTANSGATAVRGGGPASEPVWATDLPSSPRSQPVFDGETVLVPIDGGLLAVDRADGAPRWQFDEAGPNPATPTIAGDFCYVVTDRRISKVNVEEGWAAWSYRFNAEFDAFVVQGWSPPTVVGDTIFANLVVQRDSASPPTVTRVVAVDDAAGEEVWRFDTARGARGPDGPYVGAPAVDGDRLYVTSGRAELAATLVGLDRGSGSRTVAVDYEGTGWYSPTVHRGNVYLADRYLHSFDAGGTQRFRRAMRPRPEALGIAAVGDRIVAAGPPLGSDPGTVYAFSLDGDPIWQSQGSDDMCVPVVGGETVYVGDDGGTLRALTLEDGAVVGSTQLGEIDAVVGVSVGAGQLYVATRSGAGGRLRAFEIG